VPTAFLTIEAVNLAGDESTAFPVQSFSLSPEAQLVDPPLTLTVARQVNDLSAQIALLHISGARRTATLTSFDDTGAAQLRLDLTGAQVTSYSVNGSSDGVQEQFSLRASTVEMTTGSSFAVFG
jgi:hypothetical protein